MSNNLQPATRLLLPVEKLAALTFGKSYFYAVLHTRLDIHPGRIGVALKLTINNSENKVSGANRLENKVRGAN